MQHSVQETRDSLVIMASWPAGTLLAIESNKALCEKPIAPQANARN